MATSRDDLQEALGYRFADPGYLLRALTHRSYLNESREKAEDNERLEFLGDAVLDLVISEDLLQRYPSSAEGELSKMKARIVSEPTLANLARRLNLGAHLRIGRGEELTRGREKPSLLSDALEAVIAAVYLDGGAAAARDVILRMFREPMLEILQGEAALDYKTEFQELCQRLFDLLPTYTLIGATGPDHQKTFEVQLSIRGRTYGTGVGRTKKEAEQRAAKEALDQLRREGRAD